MRRGDDLAAIVVRRAWTAARLEVLGENVTAPDGTTTRVVRTPTAKKVYDLRHACLTGWLNSGVPAPQVAEWAGNSVPVLLGTYAKCISGQGAEYRRRIEDSLRIPPADDERGAAPPKIFGAHSAQPPVETQEQPESTGLRPSQ